jgi:putative Mn2+ efflux pump MntP
LIGRVASSLNGSTFVFGLIAVVSFWAAVQLCRALKGRPWYGVAARVAGALVLVGFGVLMIFYTAFGVDGN